MKNDLLTIESRENGYDFEHFKLLHISEKNAVSN